MNVGEERGVNAQIFREPLAVSLIQPIRLRHEQRRLLIVEALVGIVEPFETRALYFRVVGRRALGQNRETSAAERMMLEERFKLSFGRLLVGAQPKANYQHAIKATLSLRLV